jgi:diketogulonate reductase-like aldo/keto reductase
MHKGKDAVPIPGTTEKGNLKSNTGSVAVTLTEEEIEEVEAAAPADEVAGKRYHERSTKLARHHVVSPPFSSWKGS